MNRTNDTEYDLMEASNEYGLNARLGYPRFMDETDKMIVKAFKDGAKWMREYMMAGLCYETTVYQDDDGDGIETEYVSWLTLNNTEIYRLPENIGLKDGDKVKVIVVREEKK